MNNTEKEFVKNVCSECKNMNPEDCYIKKRMNGEYDCVNKKLENEKGR